MELADIMAFPAMAAIQYLRCLVVVLNILCDKKNPIRNLIHLKIFRSFIFGRLFHYLNDFHVCLRFVTDDACTNQIDS